MLEKKEAYLVLGVKEGASKDEISKRFNILLKIHRLSLLETNDKKEAEGNLDKINAAYNLLMGYSQGNEEKLKELENKPSNNPILRKFNLNESKLKNYVYYYKFHVIISIVVLVFLVITLRSCINRVDPDLNFVFMGDYYLSDADTTSIENSIKSNIPIIKEISTQVLTFSDKIDSQQAYAMQMKAVALMAAGDLDVFILDKASFDKYAGQGAFISLDFIADAASSHKEYKSKTEDDKTEHVYGIDAAGSKLLNMESIKDKELITAIGVKTKHPDAAKQLVKLLLK